MKKYIILLILGLIWGSSFILMKKGLEIFSPIQIAALRLFFAFLVLSPFLYKAFKNLKKEIIFPLFIVSLFGNTFPAFLFAQAQQDLDSSFVGILNSLTPIFTLLLGTIFFSVSLNKKKIISILISTLGVLILCFPQINHNIMFDSAIYLVIFATFFYGLSINIISKYLKDLDSLSISSISLFLISPICVFLIFYLDIFSLIKENNAQISLFYIFILGTLCTSIALIFFNYLIKITTPVFASYVTYIIPIVAVLWGIVIYEEITSISLLGGLIILIGIFLLNNKD